MVGYKPEEVHLTSKEYAAVGAVCGFITRVLCQPLDVVKIRFQLQIEPIRKTLLRSQPSKYHGVIQAFQTIVKEEGVTALWKGHIPAQVLSVTYGVAQFASFEILTKLTWKYLPEDLTTKYRPLTHTMCGGLAGCIAITAAQPADILRTRFVSQGNNKVYKSLYSAVRTMAKEEGLLSFYKGLGPALAQIGPQMGLQFGFYSLFTKMWEQWFRRTGLQKPGIAESVVCGSAAGMISKTLIYPLDIIKKRLEVQGFEKARADFGAVRQYRGLRHCFVTIAKEERGLRGLFKGLSPSLLKAALASSSNFLIYDQLCYLVYKSLYSAVRTMAKEEGLLSFYKGLGPALAQIGPQMGLQFGFYSLFTKMWEQWFRRTGLQKPGIAESVVCGSAAGMISKTLIYPLDIIKKRLEVQGFEKARADFGAVRQYRGLRHCFVTIAKEERGLRGLFKGLSPSLLKAALASSSNFLIYDQLCYLVRVYHSS